LKVSDVSNAHQFEILSIKKRRSEYIVLDDKSYEKVKPTSLSVYSKIIEDEKKSPLESFRNKAFNGDLVFHNNDERERFLKDIDAQINNIKIHDNNPIEINFKNNSK